MEKIRLARFLKERRRGIYGLIVETYSSVVTSMTPTMAQQVIQEDLEKESNESVKLNYVSLAQAIAKFKKRIPKEADGAKPKHNFPDAYELEDKTKPPGYFKLHDSTKKP